MLAALANARGLAAPGVIIRPQDVFATSLYTGTGASQSVNTGFAPDLAWVKTRNNANGGHAFFDRLRGAGQVIYSNSTGSELSRPDSLTAFNANGFLVGADTQTLAVNASGSTHAAWSFRRAPKFFDIVTYTGDGTSSRVIPHALGIPPGLVIIKQRDAASNWPVAFNVTGASRGLLNTTDAFGTTTGDTPLVNGFIEFQSGVVKLFRGSNGISAVNASGGTYVAYLFAHDPDTTNGIVQCGSFASNASGQATVALGWQPQFLLIRGTGASNWYILDSSRGTNYLKPNSSTAEISGAGAEPGGIIMNSTGFTYNYNANVNFVYIAIRAPIT